LVIATISNPVLQLKITNFGNYQYLSAPPW
jgi:hypothetical protein